MTQGTCPAHCPTVGVDAQPLARYASVEADGGEMIVYDKEDEDAWIQSDVYAASEECV
jgi:hypothetical protein